MLGALGNDICTAQRVSLVWTKIYRLTRIYLAIDVKVLRFVPNYFINAIHFVPRKGQYDFGHMWFESFDRGTRLSTLICGT